MSAVDPVELAKMPLPLQVLGIVVSPEVAARLQPSPPEGWKRPETKTVTKLQVLINQEGKCKQTGVKLVAANTRFDHRPNAKSRMYDPVTDDTVPSMNDPRFLDAMFDTEHDKLTFKNNGTGRGDVTMEARLRRKPKKNKAKIPARANPWPPRGSQKIPSRPFGAQR